MQSSLAKRTAGVVLGAALLQLLMITAFTWPAARTAPHDVPIVVAGPGAAATAQRLEQANPGAFDIEIRSGADDARAAITDREAYGAIVATPSGPRVLTASAASPTVAQRLTALAGKLAGERQGAPAAPAAPVQDVVAADPDDPRGSGLATLVLPLVMSSLAAAVLLTFAIPSPAWRAAGTLLFALVGGLGVAGVAYGWLSLVPGPYLLVAGVVAATVLAVTGGVAGLAAALGRPGLGLGAITFMLIGNPISGVTTAPEMLPEPWGAIGQLLPPGAAGTFMRSAVFFDGAGAGAPLAVLLGWAAVGFVLLGVGAVRANKREPAREREPVPA
ncbi:ABC transporter permease [Actinomadura algeriensis]|uniref:ABC transporter permease n=1 Tax=Actinomadura algeriensis TaxID=1679523 RepID=A0ABR9JWJ6_9ACTN|nr:ABC transporter permease [Actinomadura algeriensis]MBE1534951.1 hypothetical protein [Actinomadura algeriensis]